LLCLPVLVGSEDGFFPRLLVYLRCQKGKETGEMEQTKNLCAQIALPLYAKVQEEKDRAGQNMSQYITNLLTEYYCMKENGGNTMEKTRTMAFQIPEELFQRIKAHLERETARTGKKLTQREFVLGLIEDALTEAEQKAGVSPCETQSDSCEPQPQEDTETATDGEEMAV
jgi:hypothetical protein